MIGAVLAESILITMESNSIQMLSLGMMRGGENASVAIGIECETIRSVLCSLCYSSDVTATGSIAIMASMALRLF